MAKIDDEKDFNEEQQATLDLAQKIINAFFFFHSSIGDNPDPLL